MNKTFIITGGAGFIGTNMSQAEGYRYGTDGTLAISNNPDVGSAVTSNIVQNGTSPADTYWSAAQSGIDPIYGLIELHIPATLTHEQQIAGGNEHGRDHDYLQLEAGLYFDIIQKDAGEIVLAHDIHGPTIAAMPRALDGLLSKGYRFVTVSQLIALERRDLANDESSKELNYPSVSSEESLAAFSN